jgi:hypothetical protein
MKYNEQDVMRICGQIAKITIDVIAENSQEKLSKKCRAKEELTKGAQKEKRHTRH